MKGISLGSLRLSGIQATTTIARPITSYSTVLIVMPPLPRTLRWAARAPVAIAATAHHTSRSPSPEETAAMEMQGERRIPAPRQAVWEKLNDPEILKQCIPGCESVDKLSDTEFTAKVVARVGPVRANFTGKVTLTDLNPPQGYTISGEGQGGVAGFAKGSARVALEEEGSETVLRYGVQAQVGGKLAQIGSRLIDGTARKMADDFFGKFVALMTPGGASSEAGASTSA